MGSNSTFTNHVVTSSGTDTYSAVAASMSSLKGPRHGGANLKVMQMFADLKEHCAGFSLCDPNSSSCHDYIAFAETGIAAISALRGYQREALASKFFVR